MLNLTVFQVYQVFLVLCLPICAFVVWSDLKTMKIPNKSVLALIAVFVIAGLIIMPLEAWLWRWLNFAVVLAIGFVLNAVANVGAGDAKFAAAASLFITTAHAGLMMPLLAAFLLAAFAAHRIFRAIPAVVNATPDWVSWKRKDFPMGLALVGAFVTYLCFRAIPPFEAWVQGALASMRM
jgi:prepilin peptidase CpaA